MEADIKSYTKKETIFKT